MVALSIIAAAIFGGIIGFLTCLLIMRRGLDQILAIVKDGLCVMDNAGTGKPTQP